MSSSDVLHISSNDQIHVIDGKWSYVIDLSRARELVAKWTKTHEEIFNNEVQPENITFVFKRAEHDALDRSYSRGDLRLSAQIGDGVELMQDLVFGILSEEYVNIGKSDIRADVRSDKDSAKTRLEEMSPDEAKITRFYYNIPVRSPAAA